MSPGPVHETEARTEAPDRPAAGGGGTPTRRWRVLVVEDDAICQEVASELLREAGVDVDLADNGAEALAAVRGQAYDLVFMDVQMPVMDGLAATAAIRREPGGAGLPVVAMTGEEGETERARCRAAGMDDHLVKPVAPDQLLAAVRRWAGAPAGAGKPGPGGGVAHGAAPVGPPAGSPDPVLDEALGLRPVAGKRDLWLSLLARFVAQHRDGPAELAAALAQGDRASAQRLAHTLKGLAGTLGARRLQEEARALEVWLRDRAEATASADLLEQAGPLLRACTVALAEVVATATRRYPPSAGGGEAGAAGLAPGIPLAPADVAALLVRLESFDAEARTDFDRLREPLRAALGPDFDALARAVADFDFDVAAERLRAGCTAAGGVLSAGAAGDPGR